jgi:nitroreductase
MPGPPVASALASLAEERHSCRAFRPESVPRDQIYALLELARRAPSWCNTQPWQLIITSAAATDQLRQGLTSWIEANPPAPDLPFPERYEGTSQARRRDCAWQLYEAVGVERGDRKASSRQAAKNFELFGAPHIAIITTERALATYGAIDCGLYISYFLLAAQSLQIGAIAQAAIASCAPYLRERFAISEDRQIVCGISFGYEAKEEPANHFRTVRAEIDNMVTWIDP